MGVASLSFANATEAIVTPMTMERAKTSPRRLLQQLQRWIEKLIQEAETCKEASQQVAIALLRAKMIPQFKTLMDLTEVTTFQKYILKMEEWERTHPEVKLKFKIHMHPKKMFLPLTRNSISRFHCGKVGHISRDCLTRLATTEKAATPVQVK